MYWALLLTLLGLLCGGSYLYGPRYSIGAVSLLSLLVPTWLQTTLFGLPFDIRMVVAIASLVVVLIYHKEFFRTGLLPWGMYFGDLAVIGIAIVQCLSDWAAGGAIPIVALRSYGEWCIPYFVGRFAVATYGDAKALTHVAVLVSSLLAGTALFESVSGINLYEVGVGPRPTELAPRDDQRFGFKRAFGPVRHPIFLGAVLLLLLPWQMGFATDDSSGSRNVARWAAPLLGAAGICSTVSRAPVLCVGLMLLVIAFLAFRKLRTPILAVVACCALFLGIFWQQSFGTFIRLSNEVRSQTFNSVTIDGETLPYSSTMSRIYVFQLFRPALMQTGLLGFGTERVTGFPVNVPVKPENRDALEKLKTIENTYLLLVLRLGWLGLIAFTTASVYFVVAAGLVSMADKSTGEFMFSASWVGVMGSMLFLMITVWMPHDYGFLYLVSGGVVSSLWASHVYPGNKSINRGRL
jgi:hypothetical protein